jgi:hypothetical protein
MAVLVADELAMRAMHLLLYNGKSCCHNSCLLSRLYGSVVVLDAVSEQLEIVVLSNPYSICSCTTLTSASVAVEPAVQHLLRALREYKLQRSRGVVHSISLCTTASMDGKKNQPCYLARWWDTFCFSSANYFCNYFQLCVSQQRAQPPSLSATSASWLLCSSCCLRRAYIEYA